MKITSSMTAKCCKELRTKGIKVVVAPFEADAQLAYLCKIGHASAVVTEDSDLVVFTIALDVSVPIILKMDKYGHGKTILSQQPSLMSRDMQNIVGNKEDDNLEKEVKFLLSLSDFDSRMFVEMCVLVGSSIPLFSVV